MTAIRKVRRIPSTKCMKRDLLIISIPVEFSDDFAGVDDAIIEPMPDGSKGLVVRPAKYVPL